MRALLAVTALLLSTAAGGAAPLKVAVFDIEPFELAPTRELRDLLASESALLRRVLAERGLTVLDVQSPQTDGDPAVAACEGCAREIARTRGADLAVTTTIQEIQYPVYNVASTVRDVATNRVLRKAVVSIEGLEAEDWDRGVRSLVTERLLTRPLPADSQGLRDLAARVPDPVE